MDLANSMLSQSLFGQSMFGAEEVERIFADRARVQRMLDFEAALARAGQGRSHRARKASVFNW